MIPIKIHDRGIQEGNLVGAQKGSLRTLACMKQNGIGLIEVMLAMLIFAFTALAAGNMQTVSLGSANIANIHDDANSFAYEILEILKADRENATAETYNIAYDETVPAGTSSPEVQALVSDWRNRIAGNLPDGTGSILCDDTSCQVSVQWRQYSITGSNTQTYSMKTAL